MRRWNWKAAVFSSIMRGSIFFAANFSAGWREAAGAMFAEFVLRGVMTGFHGALTQSFRHVEPPWRAALTTLVLMPLSAHSVEITVHWLRGTPALWRSVFFSFCFTCVSTLFNLYAMRRGALIVGEEERPILHDLARVPRLIAGFLAAGPRLLMRATAQHSRSWNR
jgi:hypothetical protein